MSITFQHIEGGSTGRVVLLSEGVEGGFIEYDRRADGTIDAHETMVYEAFRGKGFAGLLFDELITLAERKHLKIYPTCSFIKKSFEQNEQLHHFLADDYQG